MEKPAYVKEIKSLDGRIEITTGYTQHPKGFREIANILVPAIRDGIPIYERSEVENKTYKLDSKTGLFVEEEIP